MTAFAVGFPPPFPMKLSPVPAYNVLVFVGSCAIEIMARLLNWSSSTATQLAGETVISVVFHNPPSTPAAQTVFPVASARSGHIALTLPAVDAVR